MNAAMTDTIEIAETLRGHLVAYRRLLQIVEAEGGDLRSGQPAAWARHSSKKKDLLPVLVLGQRMKRTFTDFSYFKN